MNFIYSDRVALSGYAARAGDHRKNPANPQVPAKGMTITEIARALGMNRNSVSKHLEVMQVAGQVEARLVGNAKVYSVAQRVPLSAFLCFTQNLILVLDADLTIIQANDQLLRHFGRTKEELVGQNIRDAAIPAVSTRRPRCHRGSRAGADDHRRLLPQRQRQRVFLPDAGDPDDVRGRGEGMHNRA